MGVLVGLLVGWMVLPSTPRSVMLSQAHPRGGRGRMRVCWRREYARCHGGRRVRGEGLTGSHQWWWCVDAGQQLLMVGWLYERRFVADSTETWRVVYKVETRRVLLWRTVYQR